MPSGGTSPLASETIAAPRGRARRSAGPRSPRPGRATGRRGRRSRRGRSRPPTDSIRSSRGSSTPGRYTWFSRSAFEPLGLLGRARLQRRPEPAAREQHRDRRPERPGADDDGTPRPRPAESWGRRAPPRRGTLPGGGRPVVRSPRRQVVRQARRGGLDAPRASAPRARAAGRGCARRTRPARRCPTIAKHGTPAWRARVADLAERLALQARSSSRPSPTMTARAARIRASKSSASRTNGAPGSSTAPNTAHSPPASPPAAPVIGTPRGSRGHARRACRAAAQPPHRRRVGALLRREHRAPRPRTPCARRTARPAARRAGRRLRDRLDRARAAVGRRACRRPPTSTTCAPCSTAATISSPVPRLDAASASRSLSADTPEPARLGHLDDRGRAVLDQPEPRLHLAAERIGHAAPRRLAAQRREQRRHRALAAVGDRAQVRRQKPARSSPRPIAAATAGARNVPLKESGATRTGRMAKTRATPSLEAAGIEVQGLSSPGKVYFPDAGVTKLDLAEFYLEFADARPARAARAPDGPQALGRRHRRRAVLPEARARPSAPSGSQSATISFPSGRTRRGARARRCRAPGLGGEPRQHRLQPAPVAPQRPRPPRRAAHRPRPAARHPVVAGQRGRDVRATRSSTTTSSSATRRRAARAASTSTSASSSAGPSRRSAAPRSRSRARSSAGCPARRRRSGGRRSARACSWTTTRTPRTTRSPRSTASAPVPDARTSCALDLGRAPRRRARRPDDRHRRRAPAQARDPYADIDDQRFALDSLLDLAQRDEDGGLGDAPWPPHFAKQPGEPRRVQPSRARRRR